MKFSNLWKRGEAARSVQTAREPCAAWNGMLPLYTRDCAVYDGLRRSIPVVDAAIDKIGRLTGGCRPVCSNPRAQAELEQLFREVPVGGMSQGFEAFLRQYLDSLLLYGNAAGEIVLSRDGESIAGLYNASVRNLHFQEGESPFEVRVCAARNGAVPVPVPYPRLIHLPANCAESRF